MVEEKVKKVKETAAFITSKDTLDGAYPGLVLGINAVRLGMETAVFYTFMGINVIRKGWIQNAKFHPPGFMGAIPGMSAIATWMMKSKITKANIPALSDLQEIAQLEGLKFVACKMTIDMMELKREDFIEGIEIQTAEDYIKHAKDCKLNMFT
jgi:peroxiredoxin family protein